MTKSSFTAWRKTLYEDCELITRGDANEGIDAHPALYDNVVGRAVNQIPGIGYFSSWRWRRCRESSRLGLGRPHGRRLLHNRHRHSLPREAIMQRLPPTNLRYFVPEVPSFFCL